MKVSVFNRKRSLDIWFSMSSGVEKQEAERIICNSSTESFSMSLNISSARQLTLSASS